jgi:hypothetical protein
MGHFVMVIRSSNYAKISWHNPGNVEISQMPFQVAKKYLEMIKESPMRDLGDGVNGGAHVEEEYCKTRSLQLLYCHGTEDDQKLDPGRGWPVLSHVFCGGSKIAKNQKMR